MNENQEDVVANRVLFGKYTSKWKLNLSTSMSMIKVLAKLGQNRGWGYTWTMSK